MHYLSSLTINNYRSCESLNIQLSTFTPLVGYNNAGKTNILSAIQWLLKKSSLTESDFYNSQNPIEVSAEIKGIVDDVLQRMANTHKRSIEPYIQNEMLRIKRVQNTPNAKAADIRIKVYNFRTAKWIDNPTGIDNALKSLLPEPIRIGAMENAEEDAAKAKTSTTIGKLLEKILTSVSEQHSEQLNLSLDNVNNQINFDGGNRLAELANIDDGINTKINDFFPGLKIKLHFEIPDISNIFKNGTIKVFENEIGRNLSCYGHGAQRSVQMALIRKLAEINTEQTSVTTLLLIDEPELYLHPMAIEQLRAALKNLSHNGYQVIFSTHSAQMITADDAINTLLVRKPSTATICLPRFHDAVNNLPDTTSQRELLFSLTNSSKILFSEKVLLVEGTTENRLLPYIFEKISTKTLGQHKIALVSIGGTGNIKKALSVLSEIGIPVKVIVDLDYAFKHACEHGYIDAGNPDIPALKTILRQLEQDKEILLDSSGLPKKGELTKLDGNKKSITAAEAYQCLALHADAKQAIKCLHSILKSQNIWLWENGTIESHLGLSAKKEAAWADYKHRLDSEPLTNVICDYDALKNLTTWLIDDSFVEHTHPA